MTCTPVPDGLQPLVLQTLDRDGYHGLYNLKLDCDCYLNDLMPCGDPCMECCPGYLQPLTDEDRIDDIRFRIGSTKHPTPEELEAAGQQTLFDPATPDNPYPTPTIE